MFADLIVDLTDLLVGDFDLVDVLAAVVDQCVEVLNVSAAGLMLLTPGRGDLQLVAFSSEAVQLSELSALQAEEGPCFDACRSAATVIHADLTSASSRWPRFATVAVARGFRSVLAQPMRIGEEVIGVLTLFGSVERPIPDADDVEVEAIAQISTVAIVHHRAAHEAKRINEQLVVALDSRIVIEQAKGILSERGGFGLDESFRRLRHYARQHGRRLTAVANDVVKGNVDIGYQTAPIHRRRSGGRH